MGISGAAETDVCRGSFGGQSSAVVEGVEDGVVAGDGQPAGGGDLALEVIGLAVVGDDVDGHRQGVFGLDSAAVRADEAELFVGEVLLEMLNDVGLDLGKSQAGDGDVSVEPEGDGSVGADETLSGDGSVGEGFVNFNGDEVGGIDG